MNFNKSIFSENANRSNLLKINILSGIGIKGLSMLLNLVFVPLVLNYLTSYKYGIWLTINSTISWFSMLDIGLSGGLRFKLQESFTNKNEKLSKSYISTTYYMLGFISIAAILIILTILYFADLNYASFFKVNPSLQPDLALIINITLVCFFFRFALQPISSILQADQLNFLQSLMLLTENILNCIGIFFLDFFSDQSLLLACLLFSITPILNLFIYTVIMFASKYKRIKPSYKYFERKYLRSLMGLGIDIFIISITLILAGQVNNIIITMYFTPDYVTNYNLVYKIFATFSTLFTIVVTPMWSAFGNAYNLNDFDWIKNVFGKIKKTYIIVVFVYILMIIFVKFIVRIWTGVKVDDIWLFITTGLYFIVQNYMMIYAFLFNGMGIIKIQRNMAIFGAIVNIPITLLLIKVFNMGLSSVLIGNIFAIIPSLYLYPRKSCKILYKH